MTNRAPYPHSAQTPAKDHLPSVSSTGPSDHSRSSVFGGAAIPNTYDGIPVFQMDGICVWETGDMASAPFVTSLNWYFGSNYNSFNAHMLHVACTFWGLTVHVETTELSFMGSYGHPYLKPTVAFGTASGSYLYFLYSTGHWHVHLLLPFAYGGPF